nr:4-demethylwyosine synthase TYW1 [Methanothermus fervidus]
MRVEKKEIERLKKMGYHFVGKNQHTAVKTCLWTKKSLLDEGVCYKEKFYGIRSHRCLQMSPSVFFCQHRCLFCWRDLISKSYKWEGPYDDPKEIVDGCIEAQRALLCGFFGNEKANKKKVLEAQNPNNAAISLVGEPTLYPLIDELIEEFHRKNFTTFLVTNGLLPERLENLNEEPTQLYISLEAPNKDKYIKICRPLVKDGWEKLNKSLEIMPTFNCRKVIRITAIKGINMDYPDKFAELIKIAEPDFVEVKAYMYLGYSRKRLKMENMPLAQEVFDFANEISKEVGMEIVDKSERSRVALLG